MNYIPYAISHTTRRVIAIMLILSFFIISPTIILYTAGYRYDWENKKLLTKGTITIDVLTENVRIFINNEPISYSTTLSLGLQQKPSVRLTNIAPNKPYTITIKKAGYHTFEHELFVRSNQTSFIKNISLIKKAEPTKLLEKTSQNQQFSFAKHAQHLLYTTQDRKDLSTLHLRSLEDQKDIVLYSTTTTLPHTTWSPHSQHIGVFFEGTTLLIDAEKAVPITQKTLARSTAPAHLWEKTERSPTLYVMNEKGVEQVTEKQTRTMYQYPSSSVWYIDEDSHLWITNEGKHTIITQVQQEETHSLSQPINQIVDINAERIIARTRDGLLIEQRKKEGGVYKAKNLSTQNLYYNDATKEWLTWNEWELWAIYENGTTTLLNRMNDPVTHIASLDKYGMLLFVTDDTFFMFNPGYYITTPLLAVDHIEHVQVNQEKRIIYFVGSVNNAQGVYELPY
ncbi:MAG: hypothetical protein HOL80_01250 [Candidatus Magasanikbacteria bacterium]|nr:hypothetical protein [Candidatus Magasanikbacteria bacterium]MBT5262508.1 hypothetical protein [Candidatus Magasanikbacteria bacterium]MBT5819996.1 hypothetical protein [Candidatus Magasanikbacteria bacterium]MBT6294723.1 hypothetical protein [Candidatus Magasanikbacteria bacterium]